MKARHPDCFVGRLPAPILAQTILEIAAAKAVFLEAVIARHPEADGQPCVVDYC